MKRIVITLFCLLILTVANGQTISKKEARHFLEKSWNYLKVSDSASFVSLWDLNPNALEHEGRPMSKCFITGNFDFMKEFLDTALSQNLKMDYIEVEKENLKGTDTKYWIKAWFKYNKHYYKGFGFYVAYDQGKWVVRNSPSTSYMRRNSG